MIQRRRRRRLPRAALCLALLPILLVGMSASAQAHDGGDTPRLGIVQRGDIFSPYGPDDHPYNGLKVFLSSPRHKASGSKGECLDVGWEENVNGRQFGWRAGNGIWYDGEKHPHWSIRNIHGRGYKALVSRNDRDGDILHNRDKSRNWGANVHIVTHSNGNYGCPDTGDYLLTWWKNNSDATDDKTLAANVGPALNEKVIGPGKREYQGWPAELDTNASHGDVYVELQFHDNPKTQDWIHDRSHKDAAYRYGLALDEYLGYP